MPAGPSAPRLRAWLAAQIAKLDPGSFALVMATGIISNAFFFEGRRGLSDALFATNLVAYCFLLTFTAIRALRFRHAIWADLINPHAVFSFFTIVAGTDVLGTAINLRGWTSLALVLWFFALILWFALIYFAFGVLTFRNAGGGAGVVHGAWLVAIVGTESLVILGAAVAPALGAGAPTAFVLIHMLWGIGIALYAVFIVLFAEHIFFRSVEPHDVSPVLWIVMGAAAISTNAGSVLLSTESALAFLQGMRAFIDGVTLILWAWATWWIPLLLMFGIWKHVLHGIPLTYTPILWSIVFPLGMYSLASLRLSLVAELPLLGVLADAMAWVALAAWAATATGLLTASWRSIRDACG